MKRKYGYIGLSVIILIFGIIVLPEIFKKLGNGGVVEYDRMSTPNNPNAEKVDENTGDQLAYIEVYGHPKRVPDFSFVDQHGDTITQKDYRGKVYVAEFFYTSCPTICPKMNSSLVKIQNDFMDHEDFAIASFSINPKHDTPKVLKDYAQEIGVKDPHWHLMTGERDSIFKLAKKGFNLYAGVNKNVPGNFQHSGYFALVDREGFIRSRRDRYGNPIIFYNALKEKELKKLREDIRKLL